MMLANTANMLNDLKMMTDVMVEFVNDTDQLTALGRIMTGVLRPSTAKRMSIKKIVLSQMTAFPLGAIFQFNYVDVDSLILNPETEECFATLNLLVIDGKLTGSIYNPRF